MKLRDGSVLSSNLVPTNSERDMFAEMYNIQKMYVGQITEILYSDNPKNRSKRFVEYNVLVNEKGITSSLFRNCRTLDSYGDQNNFAEHVLQPITDGKRGKKDDAEPTVYKNGAVVVIGFIGGNKESPFIIGGLQHPNLHLDKDVNETPAFSQVGSTTSRDAAMTELPTILPGAKAQGDNDGQRILGEFQGLRWNINKDGELTIVYQGPKDPKGKLTNAAAQPTIIKINKDGEVVLLDNLDQEIKISRKDQKIYISSGNTDPDFIEIDRANKNITIDCGNDEIHNVDHDRVVTILNDQTEAISKESSTDIGGNKKTTIAKTRQDKIGKDHLEKVGNMWNVNAGGKAVLVGPKVLLGGEGADQHLVLGETWEAFYNLMLATQLNPLIAYVLTSLAVTVNGISSAYNSHTHQYNPGGGSPTATGAVSGSAPSTVPPAIPAAPASTPAQLSDFVLVKKTYSGS